MIDFFTSIFRGLFSGRGKKNNKNKEQANGKKKDKLEDSKVGEGVAGDFAFKLQLVLL